MLGCMEGIFLYRVCVRVMFFLHDHMGREGGVVGGVTGFLHPSELSICQTILCSQSLPVLH